MNQRVTYFMEIKTLHKFLALTGDVFRNAFVAEIDNNLVVLPIEETDFSDVGEATIEVLQQHHEAMRVTASA
jgi:hypothetical protein